MPTFNAEKTDKIKKIDNLLKKIYLFPRNKDTLLPIVKDDIKELLIISFFLIGDTIMYVPALRIIKKNFPNAKITLVCEKVVEVILKNQGIIDQFVIVKCPWIIPTDYSRKNLFDFFGSVRKINKRKYDLAIDFRGDWRNIFFMNRIKAVRKASYDFTGGEYMLTDVIKHNPAIDHFTEEALYFLKQIGCEFTEKEKFPRLDLTGENLAYISTFKQGIPVQQPLIIGVHPGTSQEVKRWDENKYADVIVKLSKKYQNAYFMLFEGPNVGETIKKIETLLLQNDVKYQVIKRSLPEYIVLISICNLIICNDSGAAHIAGAFSVSTIVIFGNVEPKYVIPLGAPHLKIVSHQLECKPCFQSFCKFGHINCIRQVEEPEVYEPAVAIIDKLNNTNLSHAL